MNSYKPYICSQCNKGVIPYSPTERTFPIIPYKYQLDPKIFSVAEIVTEILTRSKEKPCSGRVFQMKDSVCGDCIKGFFFYRRTNSKWEANKFVNPTVREGFLREYTTLELIKEIESCQSEDNMCYVELTWEIENKPVPRKTTSAHFIISPVYINAKAYVSSLRVVDWGLTSDLATTGSYYCLGRGLDLKLEENLGWSSSSGAFNIELEPLMEKVPFWTEGLISESDESIASRARIRKMHGYKKLPDDKAFDDKLPKAGIWNCLAGIWGCLRDKG